MQFQPCRRPVRSEQMFDKTGWQGRLTDPKNFGSAAMFLACEEGKYVAGINKEVEGAGEFHLSRNRS